MQILFRSQDDRFRYGRDPDPHKRDNDEGIWDQGAIQITSRQGHKRLCECPPLCQGNHQKYEQIFWCFGFYSWKPMLRWSYFGLYRPREENSAQVVQRFMHYGQQPTFCQGFKNSWQEIIECGFGRQCAILIHDAVVEWGSYSFLHEGKRGRPVDKIRAILNGFTRGGRREGGQLGDLQIGRFRETRQLLEADSGVVWKMVAVIVFTYLHYYITIIGFINCSNRK